MNLTGDERKVLIMLVRHSILLTRKVNKEGKRKEIILLLLGGLMTKLQNYIPLPQAKARII